MPAAVYREPEKWLRFFTRGLLAALILFLFMVFSRHVYNFLEESGEFRVRKITVLGKRVTTEEEILALADIKQGSRLLGFRKEEAEKRISRHPWIDRVSIKRSWPYTLSIRVYEHRPLAIINIEREEEGGKLYYIDHKGIIFAPVTAVQDMDFPVITGIAPAEPQGTCIGENGASADAVLFLRFAFLGNPILPIQAVSEVHIIGEEGIIIYLVERPFPIYMGYGNIRARYYQLVKLLERLYRMKKIENIREIRMDYQADRILVAGRKP